MTLNGHAEIWVNGAPVGVPEDQRKIGTPICIGCNKPLGVGILFKGNGAVCRDCMDALRGELWQAICDATDINKDNG